MSISIETAIEKIRDYPYCYRTLPEELKNNYTVVLFTSTQFSDNLKYFPEKYKNDREIVKYCIDSNYAFKSASTELKDDKEIVLYAMDKDINNFRHISDRLKKDYDIIKKLLSNYFWGFKYLDKEFIKQNMDLQIYLMTNVHIRHVNRVCVALDNISDLKILRYYITNVKKYFNLPLYKRQIFWSKINITRPILLCIERFSNIKNIELPSELIYLILGFFKLNDFIYI